MNKSIWNWENSFASQLMKAGSDSRLLKWMIQQAWLTAKWMIKAPEDSFDFWNNSSTIVLVHGFACTSNVMSIIWNILKEKYNVAYVKGIPQLNTGDIWTSAKVLWQHVNEVLQKTEKNHDIHLLWHSLWWLIAIESIQHIVWAHINSIVTCAAPFYGTPLAKAMPFLKSLSQINTKWWYFGNGTNIDSWIQKMVAHVSLSDSFIPPSSQMPQETISTKTSIISHEEYTHTDFVVWKKAEQFARSLQF